MSATNATPIINLPLFGGTDKPAWLVDWNGAMNTIDSAIATLQTAEGGTASALAALSQSVTALSGTVEQHTTAIQTVTTATAGNTGSINTINALIGNGQPTTTDKTIIGAINEIYADIGGGDGVDADEVNYDNTSSGLTATDVQAAIDELANSSTSGSKTLRATAPANNTYASQAGTLNTAFTALTDAEKREAYIKIGNEIYQCMGANGVFTRISASPSGGIIKCVSLSGDQFITATMATSGTTASDQSSSSNDSAMELYA